MPKISIDPGIEILDSHSRKPPEHWLPLCKTRRNNLVALAAAQAILVDIIDVADHVEVIKIYYYWNINHGDEQRICADVVLVEPGTNNKKKVEANAGIYLQYPEENEGVNNVHMKAIDTLSTNLMSAIRWQILEFRETRNKNAVALQMFDDLLSDVSPRLMKKKEFCNINDD